MSARVSTFPLYKSVYTSGFRTVLKGRIIRVHNARGESLSVTGVGRVREAGKIGGIEGSALKKIPPPFPLGVATEFHSIIAIIHGDARSR